MFLVATLFGKVMLTHGKQSYSQYIIAFANYQSALLSLSFGHILFHGTL